MRIAIIGGGFFGCYIARSLERDASLDARIDIFERAPTMMSGAAANNQARVHLGFHYPRSPETIRQTLGGFRDFVEEFSEFVTFPSQNLYAIHRDGHLSFEDYTEVLDEFGLEYEVCDGQETERFFARPDDIEKVIRVGEGVIDISSLRRSLLSSLAAAQHRNALVSAVDAEAGFVTVNGEVQGPYDFIVNASYTDPSMGLPADAHFDVKYELACMVLMDHPFDETVALTIMDGEFVSLYPWADGLATLSSVPFTPFRSFSTLGAMRSHLASPELLVELEEASAAILRHGRELIRMDVDASLSTRTLFAPKCKLVQDDGATRESHIRFHHRLATVLAGKLDSCELIATTIGQRVHSLERA